MSRCKLSSVRQHWPPSGSKITHSLACPTPDASLVWLLEDIFVSVLAGTQEMAQNRSLHVFMKRHLLSHLNFFKKRKLKQFSNNPVILFFNNLKFSNILTTVLSVSFANLRIRSLARPLQSTMFPDSGLVPWAWHRSSTEQRNRTAVLVFNTRFHILR